MRTSSFFDVALWFDHGRGAEWPLSCLVDANSQQRFSTKFAERGPPADRRKAVGGVKAVFAAAGYLASIDSHRPNLLAAAKLRPDPRTGT
jgi:hypothetical protein